MSNNGSIMELVAKGKLSEEVININNDKSVFDFDITKANKYAKGDNIFYAEGKPNWGNTVRYYIERKGDILFALYLKMNLPKLSVNNLNTPIQQNERDATSKYRVRYADYIGNVLIEKASLYFNGQLIDELYGDYMQHYTDLYISDWNRKAMLGLDDTLNKPNLKIDPESIYIPLKFWFTNDTQKPLPIIAMQNTEIYIDIKFRNFNECINVTELDNNNNLFTSNYIHSEVPIEDAVLQANFYYLDLEERKQMATKEWEILITQSQLRSKEFTTNASLEIDFNHVVKDILFLIKSKKIKQKGEFFNYSGRLTYPPSEFIGSAGFDYKFWTLEPKRHLLNRARMLFNGIERIEWRDAKYFYHVQNHDNYQNSLLSYVYVYAFNIDPTRSYSNNGCDFSRLDNAQLQVESKSQTVFLGGNNTYSTNDTYELKCYATNYNILVIKGGLAGVKYSN